METVDLGIRRILLDLKNGAISASEAERLLVPLVAGQEGDNAPANVFAPERNTELDVVSAVGKSSAQVLDEFSLMLRNNARALAIRCDSEIVATLKNTFSEACANENAGVVWANSDITLKPGAHVVVVADSSAASVAEEALLTLEFAGYMPERLYGVSVADIGSLLKKSSRIAKADVVIVAAGFDGSLVAVVTAIVSCPVIAVPVCSGFSGDLTGFSALLGMLNSCVPGSLVVGVNNGYGAAVSSARILNALVRQA